MTKFFYPGARVHQGFDVLIMLILKTTTKIAEHGKMPLSRDCGDSLTPPWMPLSRDSPPMPLNASGTPEAYNMYGYNSSWIKRKLNRPSENFHSFLTCTIMIREKEIWLAWNWYFRWTGVGSKVTGRDGSEIESHGMGREWDWRWRDGTGVGMKSPNIAGLGREWDQDWRERAGAGPTTWSRAGP